MLGYASKAIPAYATEADATLIFIHAAVRSNAPYSWWVRNDSTKLSLRLIQYR